ncbi:peptidylprolyl isomerase [Halieaceae bacterium IMCC14734]|uniref:Periplasmic chaperone PpiD n=1 Tax=Candidatus Litorirhabdus singularis TaxID=2518993 RepID=A0ABT3TGF3_9GAMM|nr:SurA N-terminal domain-containing protein [Candidatus Litorirhabdus singularis]MCX2981363.1 peptidylprolyl isomerase [Candidatus Litorirhabdus singularis]
MLLNIRKNIQGTMAKVIIGLIVATFALFGVESILTSGGIAYVAEVNGEGIAASELQQQINQQKRRLLMSMGDNIDPAMLDDQMLAGPALEFMIQKKLLLQQAADYGLAVPDATIGTIIGSMDAFKVDGRFDETRYRMLLAEQGYSPASFQETLREDLLSTQLRAGVTASEFVTPQELELAAVVAEEQRDIRFLVMPLDSFRDAVSLSEDQIQQWYQASADRFQTSESVMAETIEVRASDFLEPVSEQQVKELFEAEKASMQTAERRGVAHILLQKSESEGEDEYQARVAEVAAAVQSSDQTFAELAKLYSEDLGSANFGGEIGFTSGDSFPPELESVIAELQVGEISEAIVSDAGVHILTVTEIQAGSELDYATARVELEQRLMQEQAARRLISVVEELRDQVFNAETLSAPAESLGLTVNTGVEIFRDTSAAVASDPRVVSAAFSSEVLEDRFNSEVIELADSRFLVLRVVEHKLPTLKSLESVRETVEALATEAAALDAASAASEQVIARLQSGDSIDGLAQELGYEWQVELAVKRDSRTLSPELLRKAFTTKAPSEGQSRFDFVATAAGDIEIFELARVSAGQLQALVPVRRERLMNQVLQDKSRTIDGSYQRSLRAEADIVKS